METIIYNDEIEILNKIVKEYHSGNLLVICPKCKEEVIIVLDVKDAQKHQRGPGIYCRNGDFVSIFNMR